MSVTLRAAEMRDWARLFAWRNDPATLAASVHTEPVPLEIHLKWLAQTVGSKTTLLYVARDPMVGDVGTCRVDRRSKSLAEVSLTVAPEHRGHGYAAAILMPLTFAAYELEGVTVVRAEVREDNYASLRAFAVAGYAFSKVKDGLVTLDHRAKA